METQALVRHLGLWSRGKGSLQEKLAHSLMDAIRHGIVTPGLRLPSERDLSRSLAISRTTVVGAYNLLRDEGWLESRPGSGTRVCARTSVIAAARSAAHVATLAASPLLGMLAQREGDDTLDFALGTPFPLASLPPEMFVLPSDEYLALMRDRLYYPFGLPALRQAIASHYSDNGLPTETEQVLVTSGAQHAIALCAALCLQRGDAALVEDPAYFGTLDAFRALGARISALPVEQTGVPPSSIRDRIRATGARLIYLTPTFQNPTGAIIPSASRKEIVRFVSEFGVPLIDDGTMSDFVLEGRTPPPMAACDATAEIFTIGSISKLVCPGLRIGWVRAPETLIQRLARLKTAMDLGSPLITQAIAIRLVHQMTHLVKLRQQQLRPRRDLLAELLRSRLPEWKFRPPPGGLFLWINLGDADAREFAQVALRHGVVILPGTTMSAAGQFASFLRLPFFAEPETLRKGVDRLRAAWREYKSADRRKRQPAEFIV